MINLKDVENLVLEIPQSKLENLADYLINKELSSLSLISLQEDLKLNSTETNIVRKICSKTHDGNILSLLIKSILVNKSNQDQVKSKLIMTGNFQSKQVDYTHETIYQMIHRAHRRITIIGYWVYEMKELFEELSKIQEKKELEIDFILDSAPKWKEEIISNWNTKFSPRILEVDKKSVKTLHAKIIIIDNSEILITSANLTINAMEKNIEAGIWSNDSYIVDSCRKIFKDWEDKKIITEIKRKKY